MFGSTTSFGANTTSSVPSFNFGTPTTTQAKGNILLKLNKNVGKSQVLVLFYKNYHLFSFNFQWVLDKVVLISVIRVLVRRLVDLGLGQDFHRPLQLPRLVIFPVFYFISV